MIVEESDLRNIRNEHEDATIALRFGCYDLLHLGHQKGINFAAQQADILVLGVMPDNYVNRTKGPDRPINAEATRVERIDSADGVDYSFIAPSGRFALAGIVRSLHPDVYVEDEEYGESFFKKAYLNALGVDFVIDRESRYGSTSEMIARLGIDQAIEKSRLDFDILSAGLPA
jgi:cytidyltransferase-like protein